jgi:hypothetical protein
MVAGTAPGCLSERLSGALSPPAPIRWACQTKSTAVMAKSAPMEMKVADGLSSANAGSTAKNTVGLRDSLRSAGNGPGGLRRLGDWGVSGEGRG